MKDQVAMATNGQLVVAIPLYRYLHEEPLAKMEGYSIALTMSKPIAYVIDCGELGNQLFNSKFVEKNLEFLGDLE